MEINIKLEIGRLFDKEAFDDKIRLLHQVISLLEIERDQVSSRKTQWDSEMKEIHDFKKKESVLKKKESLKEKKVKGKAKKDSSDVNVFVSSIGIEEDLAHDEEELSWKE
jgi:hypothetical protein